MQLFSRAMSFAAPSFIGRGRLERKLQAMRFHITDPGHAPSMQRPETRLLAYAPYLELLHGKGHERATAWLPDYAATVEVCSSIDLEQCFG